MNQFLLYEFKTYMKKKNFNKQELAINSGIHISDISRIFNNKKTLSIRYLDAITKAFDLPIGFFYSKYAYLCFNQNRSLNKRRSIDYLYNCVMNNFNDEFSAMISIILEENSKIIRTKNLQILFLVAEKLFLEGHEKESLPIYDIIINHMPDHSDEEVSISYFRKYYITRLTEEGQSVLGQVLENLRYMPEKYQELTLLCITNTKYMLKEWDKLLYYAKRLEKIAKNKDHYGRALMYQCIALRNLDKNKEDVLELIDRYEKVNEYFAEIAVGNRFVALIDFGELHYVDDYYEWIKDREDLYVGIPRILEAYVRLGRFNDALNLINSHGTEIAALESSADLFKQQLYLDYSFALALLKCETSMYIEGLDAFIVAAMKMKNVGMYEKVNQCLLAIWHYKEFLTPQLEIKYIQLLSNRKFLQIS